MSEHEVNSSLETPKRQVTAEKVRENPCEKKGCVECSEGECSGCAEGMFLEGGQC